jgi:hypothetical protein
MTTATQALIQTLATVETLTSDIDALYVLDQQAKAIALQVKEMKDAIANKYGECDKDAKGKVIPHRGELHSVKVSLSAVKGTVDMDKVMLALGMTEAEFDKQYRGESTARITVTPTA